MPQQLRDEDLRYLVATGKMSLDTAEQYRRRAADEEAFMRTNWADKSRSFAPSGPASAALSPSMANLQREVAAGRMSPDEASFLGARWGDESRTFAPSGARWAAPQPTVANLQRQVAAGQMSPDEASWRALPSTGSAQRTFAPSGSAAEGQAIAAQQRQGEKLAEALLAKANKEPES